ncbi:MAG: DNA-binding protein [Sphingobacteriales bacterium]|nr:MAG: DNA-binding protein [Sphingobacteriales bacterium]
MHLSLKLICYSPALDDGGGGQPNDAADKPLGRLLDMQDILQLFKITSRTAHNWVRQGILQPIRIGGRIYFLESEVEEMIRRMRGK